MPRVLIIDDEPWICRMLVRLLGSDHEVVAVSSVREALLSIGERRFDIILCDLRLGGHSGLMLRAELTEHHPRQASRIVFMSGDHSAASRVDAPFLAKPFDAATLQILLARCLHTWGAIDRTASRANAS